MPGAARMNGRAGTSATIGRRPHSRSIRITSSTAVAMLTSSSGSLSIATVVPPSMKKGAAIQASTPSM